MDAVTTHDTQQDLRTGVSRRLIPASSPLTQPVSHGKGAASLRGAVAGAPSNHRDVLPIAQLSTDVPFLAACGAGHSGLEPTEADGRA